MNPPLPPAIEVGVDAVSLASHVVTSYTGLTWVILSISIPAVSYEVITFSRRRSNSSSFFLNLFTTISTSFWFFYISLYPLSTLSVKASFFRSSYCMPFSFSFLTSLTYLLAAVASFLKNLHTFSVSGDRITIWVAWTVEGEIVGGGGGSIQAWKKLCGGSLFL